MVRATGSSATAVNRALAALATAAAIGGAAGYKVCRFAAKRVKATTSHHALRHQGSTIP
jgi:hypothetical protein